MLEFAEFAECAEFAEFGIAKSTPVHAFSLVTIEFPSQLPTFPRILAPRTTQMQSPGGNWRWVFGNNSYPLAEFETIADFGWGVSLAQLVELHWNFVRFAEICWICRELEDFRRFAEFAQICRICSALLNYHDLQYLRIQKAAVPQQNQHCTTEYNKPSRGQLLGMSIFKQLLFATYYFSHQGICRELSCCKIHQLLYTTNENSATMPFCICMLFKIE